jgi:two-component system sensor histidine kinase and response regulator WspE
MEAWLQLIRELMPVHESLVPAPTNTSPVPSGSALVQTTESTPAPVKKSDEANRFLRLTAENLNRLLALAGESLVESRWLRPFSESMQRLAYAIETERTLDNLRQSVDFEVAGTVRLKLAELLKQTGETRNF